MKDELLVDVPKWTMNWTILALVLIAEAGLFANVLLGYGPAALLYVMMIALAFGATLMLLPPTRNERIASAWWNGLSKSEREKWLTVGAGSHHAAWEAYKSSSTTVRDF